VSQPGFLRFHYELATHSGFDAVNAARVAAFARSPLIAHPAVAVSQPEIGRLIDVDGDGIVIAAAERLEDGARVWLQNLTDSPRSAAIHLSQWKLRSASLCDTFGREGKALIVKNEGVTLTVPARGVTGLRLTI